MRTDTISNLFMMVEDKKHKGQKQAGGTERALFNGMLMQLTAQNKQPTLEDFLSLSQANVGEPGETSSQTVFVELQSQLNGLNLLQGAEANKEAKETLNSTGTEIFHGIFSQESLKPISEHKERKEIQIQLPKDESTEVQLTEQELFSGTNLSQRTSEVKVEAKEALAQDILNLLDQGSIRADSERITHGQKPEPKDTSETYQGVVGQPRVNFGFPVTSNLSNSGYNASDISNEELESTLKLAYKSEEETTNIRLFKSDTTLQTNEVLSKLVLEQKEVLSKATLKPMDAMDTGETFDYRNSSELKVTLEGKEKSELKTTTDLNPVPKATVNSNPDPRGVSEGKAISVPETTLKAIVNLEQEVMSEPKVVTDALGTIKGLSETKVDKESRGRVRDSRETTVDITGLRETTEMLLPKEVSNAKKFTTVKEVVAFNGEIAKPKETLQKVNLLEQEPLVEPRQNLILSPKVWNEPPQAVIKNPTNQNLGLIQNQINTQLIKNFTLMQKNGLSQVNVDLKPEFLGQVSINLLFEKGKVTAKIEVAKEEVKRLLEGQVTQLKAALNDLNIKVEEFKIEQNDKEPSYRHTNKEGNLGEDKNGRGNQHFEGKRDFKSSAIGSFESEETELLVTINSRYTSYEVNYMV